jgi:osmoprotectant transport system permease protein
MNRSQRRCACPEYLGQHVILSAAALGLGLLISVPLALAASRSERLRWPVLAFASLVQTIPSLALLALFYPLLLALSALSLRLFGHGFSALGFLPSLLALTLYSMLPIIRNGVAAILHLDPAIIEAAHGVGMTDRQRLLRVELPLAAPVLMAGIRTAAVWVIGAATLSTPVGQTSLGNYIFSGLQVENWVSVLFGCVAAAALALVTDQLLALIETGVAQRTSWRVWAGCVALLAGIVAAAAPVVAGGAATYVIGAKTRAIDPGRAHGGSHRARRRIGAPQRRPRLRDRLRHSRRAIPMSMSTTPARSGRTSWVAATHAARAVVLGDGAGLQTEHGVVLLGALGFENAYALAMRRDLAPRSVCARSRTWRRLRRSCGWQRFRVPRAPGWHCATAILAFSSERQFQPTFMYQAPRAGSTDLGVPQRRPHRRQRSRRARGSAAARTALRCSDPPVAAARARSGAA